MCGVHHAGDHTDFEAYAAHTTKDTHSCLMRDYYTFLSSWATWVYVIVDTDASKLTNATGFTGEAISATVSQDSHRTRLAISPAHTSNSCYRGCTRL